MSGNVLPGDAPAQKLLGYGVQCSAGNVKPADAWLKGESPDETAWPTSTPTKFACYIMKVFASRGMTVCGSPFCIVTAVCEGPTVEDLCALEHVLEMFEVAVQVGRLLACVM